MRAAICWSPKLSSRASRVSLYVAPFGAPCSMSVARPYKATIKYMDFSWLVQQLRSATVSNWCRNKAHDVVPSNLGGFPAPAPVPVPILLSAPVSFQLCPELASGASILTSILSWLIHISDFNVRATIWNMWYSSSWRSFLVFAMASWKSFYVHYIALETPGPCIDGRLYCL
jgi:hypothetical protein